MSAALVRLVAVFLAFILCSAPALSQETEEAPEPSITDRMDAAFGQYVVGNLAWVMFYDLVFWDNTLALGDGVGTIVGDEEVTGHSAEGYTYQRQFTVAEPVISLDAPIDRRMGKIDVEIRSGTRSSKDGEVIRAILVAHVPAQEIDLGIAGLEPPPEGVELTDEEAIVTVTDLSDFSVRIDRRTAMVVPQDVVLPDDAVDVEIGSKIDAGDDGKAEVISLSEDGSAVVRSVTKRLDPTPLANPENAKMPAVVAWLVFGSVFFTLRMFFVNIWGFGHALVVTAGRYDNPEDEGEISHFQALSSALSATVGLGNIAGVAIAISVGGPGAIFWMVVAGFLGMTSKFTECTLGQMYRVTKPDGTVSGGPMYYLDRGLSEMGLGILGKFLAWTFAIMCVGGSLGGGNMFQANQSYAAVAEVVPFFANPTYGSKIYGVLLAVAVGLVIIGGIKRIGAAAGTIVPLMCGIYLLGGLVVVVANAAAVPAAITAIVHDAFSPAAGLGGLIGVLAQGFKRASFSSEAGVGSASIAHSAASTPYPVREGIVSLLEPFIDTIVVCSMTGIVVVVTGAYLAEDVGSGVVMTQQAFGTVMPWFPMVLSFAVLMFAFSTMISWSYYGEKAVTWMFGEGMILPYRVLFLICVWCGSVFQLGSVLDFSDLMVLAMAFPNILGAILLSGKVKKSLDEYWAKLKAGEFQKA